MTEYIKPFLLGGSIIAGTKFVSTRISPALAPLIGGMPTGILASYFLSTRQAKSNFFWGYSYSSFILFLTIVAIHIVSVHTKLNIDIISILGLILWGILSYFIVVKATKKTVVKKISKN